MSVVYSIGTGIPGTDGVADLTLDAVQQLGYEQIPIWDGPTYLYTTFRFHWRGTYNPANGFAWGLIPQQILPSGNFTGTFPGLIPGSLPPTTNVAIRHFLMQPRGRLTYTIGGLVQPAGDSTVVVIGGLPDIICPTTIKGADENDAEVDYQTDCKNGPVPLSCNVVEIKGTKTFLVDWAVECYINEAYIFRTSTTLSALLSQRWTIEEDLDEDFFSTRTITGHAIFRADQGRICGGTDKRHRGRLPSMAHHATFE